MCNAVVYVVWKWKCKNSVENKSELWIFSRVLIDGYCFTLNHQFYLQHHKNWTTSHFSSFLDLQRSRLIGTSLNGVNISRILPYHGDQRLLPCFYNDYKVDKSDFWTINDVSLYFLILFAVVQNISLGTNLIPHFLLESKWSYDVIRQLIMTRTSLIIPSWLNNNNWFSWTDTITRM